MSQEYPQPLAYHLETIGPVSNKLVPRSSTISRASAKFPLARRGIDWMLGQHFKISANDEVWQAYRENWLNFATRVISEPLDRPKHYESVSDYSISPSTKKVLKSGVTKVTAKLEKEKVTCFVAPKDFVPFSLRTMDILPNKDESIPVSATLRYIAKKSKNSEQFPAIQMTSAGWNYMTLFSDVVYLSSLDEYPAQHHVSRHLRDTIVSIDTRSDAQYFTVDDFFDIFYNSPRDFDVNGATPLVPGKEAHWLVTNKDGNMDVLSTSDIRAADVDRDAFKSKIASIASTVGYVDQEIAQEPLGEGADVQLVNAVVLFNQDGEQRVGSIHAQFDSNAIGMYTLANKMITEQFPGAENIAVCIMDGGGSSGAIVQKKKNWQRGRKNTFEKSTLPPKAVSHEVPVYTAMVPAEYVRKRYRD